MGLFRQWDQDTSTEGHCLNREGMIPLWVTCHCELGWQAWGGDMPGLVYHLGAWHIGHAAQGRWNLGVGGCMSAEMRGEAPAVDVGAPTLKGVQH